MRPSRLRLVTKKKTGYTSKLLNMPYQASKKVFSNPNPRNRAFN
jgi:hypothetical protein